MSKQRRYEKRSRTLKFSRKQLYTIVALTLIVVSSLAVYAFFNQSQNQFKAAIVDQLSSRQEFENMTFVKTANETLTAAGYTVTYYKGSDVTVDFYRTLPSHGYKILILRVHSALRQSNGELTAPLSFFTSEPYSVDKYQYDQMQPNRLDIAMYHEGGEQYFGILYGFVAHSMQGRFQDTVIIMMGCNGLDRYARSQTMVQTLIGKGAKVYIGWDEAINVQHTDSATARLLHNLLVENRTIKDAVNKTMQEVGPDPYFESKLKYYPSKDFFFSTVDIGNYTIPRGPVQSDEVTGAYPMFKATQFFVLLSFLSSKQIPVSEEFEEPASSVSHDVLKQ